MPETLGNLVILFIAISFCIQKFDAGDLMESEGLNLFKTGKISWISIEFGADMSVSMKKAVCPLTSLTDASRADFLIFPFYPEDGGDTFLRNVG
jgi:hypothetical protein